MISIVVMYPSHLNLNGDLANAKVLKQRLSWRGVDSTITYVEKGDKLPDRPDFILLGHGSEAAWDDISAHLESHFDELLDFFESGVPGLVVASGYERMRDLAIGTSLARAFGPEGKIARVSKFALAELDGKQALGYINSTAALAPLVRYQNLFATLLHGPVLAKNEWLAEQVIESIFERRGQVVPEIQAREKADRVADLIAKVWELEETLARE